jgi:hypothetical protein
MKKTSRNVEVDPGKSGILRSAAMKNLLIRGRGSWSLSRGTLQDQLRRDRPLLRKRAFSAC